MVSWGPFHHILDSFLCKCDFICSVGNSFFYSCTFLYSMCFPAVGPIGSIFVLQQFIGMFDFCYAHTEGTRSHMHSAYQLLRQAWYLPRKTDNPDGTMKVDVEETDYCALAQLWTAEWLRFGMFEKMRETMKLNMVPTLCSIYIPNIVDEVFMVLRCGVWSSPVLPGFVCSLSFHSAI